MLFTQTHKDFLNWLEVIKNKSPKTIEQYNRHLEKFENYILIKNLGVLEVEKITLDIAE